MKARGRRNVAFSFITFLWFWTSSNCMLSPKGVNFEGMNEDGNNPIAVELQIEQSLNLFLCKKWCPSVTIAVQALIGIKDSLEDPHAVLDNWDGNSVDPCSWTMVTCSAESLVIGLGAPSQSLSGTLSPSIGNLTNLQIVLLQNNNISGTIPTELGKLSRLHTLDLSNNRFTGEIPTSLSQLRNLQYMRLNNNSLSWKIPLSLSNMTQLQFLDLSFNNLSGPVPKFPAKTFSVVGNPSICATGSEGDCCGSTLMPMSMPLNGSESTPSMKRRNHKAAVALGSAVGFISLLTLAIGIFLQWRQRRNKQLFFDVYDKQQEEITFGNLRRFQFRELQIATDNFSNKNILGKGGFGNVYKGYLRDGTAVAVKRLKDGSTPILIFFLLPSSSSLLHLLHLLLSLLHHLPSSLSLLIPLLLLLKTLIESFDIFWFSSYRR